jgi:hypothetical protein
MYVSMLDVMYKQRFRPIAYSLYACVYAGLIEFMTSKFVKRRFPLLYSASGGDKVQQSKRFDASAVDWHHSSLQQQSLVSVTEVDCVTLQEVLEAVGVSHVNFLVLDVEGGEISVLQSIDFNKISFDVMVIERQSPTEVIKFMKEVVDYELVAAKGRNLWYKRRGYMPSHRSTVNKKCYRGCLTARGQWHCAHSASECTPPPGKH